MSQEPALRRHWRKIWRISLGSIVVLIGVILSLPLVPGPGILTILFGLAIMADEVPWARRLLDRLKMRAKRAEQKVRGRRTRSDDSVAGDERDSPL